MTLDPRGMIFIDGYDPDDDADVDANDQIVQEKFEDAMKATLISETVKAQSVSSDIEITVYPECYNYKGMPAMSLKFRVPPEPYPGLWNGETYKDVVLDGLTASVLYKALAEIYARIESGEIKRVSE